MNQPDTRNAFRVYRDGIMSATFPAYSTACSYARVQAFRDSGEAYTVKEQTGQQETPRYRVDTLHPVGLWVIRPPETP